MGSNGLSNQEKVIGRSWFCQTCHNGNGFVIIASPNLRERLLGADFVLGGSQQLAMCLNRLTRL